MRHGRAIVSIGLLTALILGTAVPSLAQDDTPPVTTPAPADPPVTPVPNDPLVNEGASEALDPNTPLEPGAVPGTSIPEETQDCVASEDSAAAAAGQSGGTACPPKRTGRYSNQPEFVPDSLRRAEVRRVTSALEQSRSTHVQNVAKVRSLRLRDKELGFARAELSEEVQETLTALEITEEQMRRRALASFVNGDTFELARSLEHDEILQVQKKRFLVGEVLALDQELLDEYTRLRNKLAEETLLLYERVNSVRRWLRSAEDEAETSAAQIDLLEYELDTWNYLSTTWIPEVVFPIVGAYEFPLINSWGYPRAPGTIDAHWHEGIDIFAPTGSPLVAAEAGEITDIGFGTLGGLKIWIMGESGTRWYYAHLDAFNPKLVEGDFVNAGDLIGYVGASGNAVGTPPHLHLQIHPDSGRPVNPYPILQAASDRFQALVAIGRAPTFDPLLEDQSAEATGTRDEMIDRGTAHLEGDATPSGGGTELDGSSEDDPARVEGAISNTLETDATSSRE